MSAIKIALVAFEGCEVPDYVKDPLREHGADFIFEECTSREQLLRVAGDAHIVWVRSGSGIVTADVLDEMPNLYAILRTGTGTDNVPVAAATERGILVANTPEAAGETVAEHAVALMLACARQIAQQDRLVRAGVWDRYAAWPDWHLTGQTLGLIGFGYISQRVRRKVSGFDMRVLVHDPYINEQVIRDAGATAVSLDELLAQSHFVSIHTPLTTGTRHMLGEAQFKQMRKDAIFINTSRGPVVDEAALIKTLQEKWIGGAGLDVMEEEPLPPASPLLQLPNVVVTPHIAGYSDLFLENFWKHSVGVLLDLIRQARPRWVVNPQVKSMRPIRTAAATGGA